MTTPPQLPDEIVEEFLLRFPPDDPESLLRAALVCKRWSRLVCGRRFRARFRAFHRAAPMLGAIVNNDGFFPTSSFRCQLPADLRTRWRVLDARHGRVLFHSVRQPWDPALALWDPITGERRVLPNLPRVPNPDRGSSNFAVVCAAAGCNHLDCSRGPFLVVAVVVYLNETFARVYSSEDGEWGEPIFAPHINHIDQHMGRLSLDSVPGFLVGDAVYFLFRNTNAVFKFDLTTRKMVRIHLSFLSFHRSSISFVTTQDGGLGFAVTKGSMLYLLSMAPHPNEGMWELSRAIELDKLLPATSLKRPPIMLCSAGAIFLNANDGVFSADLDSFQARKMPKEFGIPDYVVPFVSFCTPALEAANADEEP